MTNLEEQWEDEYSCKPDWSWLFKPNQGEKRTVIKLFNNNPGILGIQILLTLSFDRRLTFFTLVWIQSIPIYHCITSLPHTTVSPVYHILLYIQYTILLYHQFTTYYCISTILHYCITSLPHTTVYPLYHTTVNPLYHNTVTSFYHILLYIHYTTLFYFQFTTYYCISTIPYYCISSIQHTIIYPVHLTAFINTTQLAVYFKFSSPDSKLEFPVYIRLTSNIY